ncbi:hypothetical protein PVAND_002058 [Polypedilum vanderplanki]|uniref:Pv-fam-d protein n=1 Tax=Polypedilum vanderplanki TaxID=319348 RepID=A0A9J6BPT7_POLVA|nr:hypothetical protein PVAND_002058 [Polypedilum vanderplanki]
MRIEIYFVLAIIILNKDATSVSGKSIMANDAAIERQFEDYMNCSRVNSSNECLESTGRKRKGKPGNSGGNNVVLLASPGQSSNGVFEHHPGYEYIEVDDFEDQGGKRRRRRGKKNKRKKGKKGFIKKMKPFAYGVGGLKLLFDHFLLKKLFFLSVFNFFLSKVSFILATLVALKQFFHNPSGHSRAESHKVEVLAIPVKKHKSKFKESHFFDESKIVPITFQSELETPETTPAYFTYPSHGGFISSEEEAFNDLINDNNKEIMAVNDEVDFMKKNNDFDRKSDTIFSANDNHHDEKSYYLNHVHSPFV